MLTLPKTTYTTYADYGPRIGIGSADFSETLDDAADAVIEAVKHGASWRVERTDRDVENNAPESVSDVSEQIAEIIWHRAFGRVA